MKNIIKISGVILIFILIQSCKKEADNITKDIDGNVYNSVTIGTQIWMKENLKTTKYRNGDLIGTTTPATLDITSEVSPKYQWAYNGEEINASTYGRLYTWDAVTDARNVCPTGWHVPTDTEWHYLILYLDSAAILSVIRPSIESEIAGGKLKEWGTNHWGDPNTGATNESGFTAIPGGYRAADGRFSAIGLIGNWWSSTEDFSSTVAYYRLVDYWVSSVTRDWEYQQDGLSVRCLKD
jgi:uncharacterized protein (TIGR02145 family)